MIHPDNLVHPDLSLGETEDYPASIVCYFGDIEKGVHFATHSHRRAQLFHIVSGSLTLETERGTFVVPPERAVWIPSNVPHAVTYLQNSSLRYLFFRPEAVPRLPGDASVVRLSTLLRELIQTFMEYSRDDAVHGPAKRIADVIVDQLEAVPVLPLYLPMPTSARIRRAVRLVADDPGAAVDLGKIAGEAALSERSFERHFQSETGLSFRAWRQQARLMKAVEWLSLGLPVGEVADRLGYEQPSAFVSSFRKAFGVTPSKYFSAEQPKAR
jgi:AraC-like DNA-binding protein